MKKIFIILACILFAVIGIIGYNSNLANGTELSADSFLRIHIRANSNEIEDQNVKYLVKDKLVEYLTPILINADTKSKAMELINQNLLNIDNICSLTLQNAGYNYSAKAKLTREKFPTRAYDNVVLQSGEYDSLIVSLGTGTGNNWWCVVYPPLCFVTTDNSSSNVVYHSKILDIIRHFFGGE